MNIQPAKSIFRLWSFANVEAWFCHAAAIEPVHFWIAALKMADPEIAGAMLDAGATAEECKEQAAESRNILSYLETDADSARTLRRKLRSKLLRGRVPREMPENGSIPYLHRSETSRRVFEIAARKAAERHAKFLSTLHLLESLFDMQLVSLGEP